MADSSTKEKAKPAKDTATDSGKTFKDPAEDQVDTSKEYDGPGLSTAARDRVLKNHGLVGDTKVKVEVAPKEAEQNGADWTEGRDPLDVVEVSGQRETVEARMARNGQASPQKAVGATTLR